MQNIHEGSLGEIEKDSFGNLYTTEDDGYSARFWFESKDDAIRWLKDFLNSYSYMMGESYLEKHISQAIEYVRSEWTIKVCYDFLQMRMNDIQVRRA